MRRLSSIVCLTTLVAATTLAALPVKAQVTGFVSNPTTNSIDWENFVTGFGSVVNKDINFDTHPTGALQSDFYLGSHGVTLTSDGDVNQVVNGTGPSQGNVSVTPLSPGEGPHAPSNYLTDDENASRLTISFDAPINGFGLFVIDYYNSLQDNLMVLEAYTGQNGTGTAVGVFYAAPFNFQIDNQYFMGVATTSGENLIQSVVLVDVNNEYFDITGIDDIRYSRLVGTAPEPASLALLGLALPLIGVVRRRKP